MTLPKPIRLNAGPRGVMLFHGLSSGPQELQYLARGLHRAGYTVRVPVIEGYSFGLPSTQAVRAERWQAAALAEFDAFRADCESAAVGGLCIGAVLALRIAALRSGLLSAVIGLSTTLHYDGWATPWYRRLLPLSRIVPFSGRIGVAEKPPFGVKDERMRGWIERQMADSGLSQAGASVLRVRDLMQARRLIAQARRALPDITAPTLLIHAREDDAASVRSAFEAASRVGAKSVRCVLLSDSYHMISIDREKQRVLNEMIDFLEGEHDTRKREGDAGASDLSSLFKLNV
jgi:carboxylesterase